jgi:DNA polymerase III subunit epsilon
MIDNILILDTETTGLEPAKGAQVIEVAAHLFNIHHREIIQTVSTLLACDNNPVQDINNIDPEWTRVRKEEGAALRFLGCMSRQADYIVAHNAQFDKKFMNTLKFDGHFSQMQWICTQRDFKWPVQLVRYRLQDICEAMGVAYVDAHRALTDCNFLADCFKRIDDLDKRFYNASQELKSNDFGLPHTNPNKFR